MNMVPTVVLPKHARALYAQGINMVEQVGDDEEEDFLRTNESVIPVYDIDVEKIIDQYKLKKHSDVVPEQEYKGQEEVDQDELEQEISEQDEKLHIQQIIQAEKAYEEHKAKTARVMEDELQDLNLGTEQEPQTVKISIHVGGQFKADLSNLLMEFKDIFAWKYTDMKGVDPRFCMHKINLKKDAVPVV